jgi:hypothetical protein
MTWPHLARRGGIALLFCAFSAWEIATPRLAVRFETPAGHMWVPRLGMALAAALGIAAVFVFLARVVDRRAGAYAAAILATTPLWFVHGRTSTGAILPMAASAFVLAGLGVALLAHDARPWSRIAGACVALLGAAVATKTHSLAIVCAPPAIAISIAALLRIRRPVVAAVGVLVIGVAVLVFGAREGISKGTFDAPVGAIAYALMPWTPLVPIALGARMRCDAHRGVVLCAALAIGAHAFFGASAFVGVAPIACAVALALRSIESDVARPSVAMVLVVVVVGVLVARDLDVAPERVASALAAPQLALATPEITTIARAARAATLLAVTLGVVALVVPRAWLPTSRGLAILFAGVLSGCVLRVYAYPSLLARLSPGEAFELWAHVHRDGEPLGALSVDTRALSGATGSVVPFGSADRAGAWLADPSARSFSPVNVHPHERPRETDTRAAGPERRFLLLAASELATVNAAYRVRRGVNVPILAGHAGSVLLAASELAPDEVSESPLDRIVMSAPPENLHPLGAMLGDRLEAVGWETIGAVQAGSRAHVRFAVRVLAPPTGAYCTFLHVDNSPTRFSAEHKTHTYPMSLWREGDVVIDDFEVTLPAHFHAGRYAMYWGVGVLPCSDDKRMPITSGPDDGHSRVPAGFLEVK